MILSIHRIPILCGIASLVTATNLTVLADIPLKLDTSRHNQLQVISMDDGAVELHATGTDPYIFFREFDTDSNADENVVLAFEYFCPDGIDGVDVYYGPPVTAENMMSAGSLEKAEGWQPFSVNLKDASRGRWTKRFNLLRLDLGKREGRTVQIRSIVLRAPNEAERRSQAEHDQIRAGKLANANRVTDYLSAEMSAKIESVVVDAEQIHVSGHVDREVEGNLYLTEAQPWQELWEGSSGHESAPNGMSQSRLTPAAMIELGEKGFAVSVPRFDNSRDRITSRWAVVAEANNDPPKLVSHYVYPTDLRAACVHPDLDRKRADGLKGMGAWANDILEELVELGVKHITLNLPISSQFSGTEQPGWIRFSHNARDWWVRPTFVEEQDRLIRFATDHRMVVSAILLVGFGDDGFTGILQHPEADRAGNYAMPNLTTPEGVAAYEAAIYFLAGRYAQPGDPNGRISNWILHNEIDYGWVWTNMGEQPLPVYLDTYIRSMRIVHNIARQFNPHARTFISLTHNWHKENDPAWRTYSPRTMLELLAEFSRAEGDFEWGVAYHPYPQSLFNPDAWNDTQATDNSDTPLITPKNIAVLDRWMHRDEMLFHGLVGTDPPGGPFGESNSASRSSHIESSDTLNGRLGEAGPTLRGKLRAVLLSEQGFHTPDESEDSQRLQAAAFLYMWRQMRGLESIEAFHNHRWVDHPHEGGLKLGIRTLPGDGMPYGEKKYGWQVYQALDTPAEASFAEELDSLIGKPR